MTKIIKVALVRGKYLNNFEGQNYFFDKRRIDLTAFSSLWPIHRDFVFKTVRLPSLVDLADIGPAFLKRGLKFCCNRLLGDSQILFGLEKYADQFDIFHTADPHYFYSYQLARLRSENKIFCLISTSWETIPFNNETVFQKKNIKYFTQRWVDRFVCYTKRAKASLIQEGVDPKKIEVIRLGVDLTKFKYRHRREKHSTVVLFVGRLVEEKGILDLYQVFREIKSQSAGQNLKLKIIGDGPLKSKLLKMIKIDGLVESVIVEKESYQQIEHVYQQADIFVLPSKRTKTWEEQYGVVLIEAMASGLAIVAYDSGAIQEIIGEAGLLVKQREVKELFSSLKQLVQSEKLRLKLGKIGRKRAEKLFDCRVTAARIADLYSQIINNK